jgi:hypothetical protein
MLGTGPNPRLRDTIKVRDDRPPRLAPAHYPISAVKFLKARRYRE